MSYFTEIKYKKPLLIAGPCSAESEEQVLSTSKILSNSDVDMLRFGVWKPRTSPGSFEGYGEKALPWVQKAKEVTGLPVTIEVANAGHVEKALEYGIDVLWIGARTTVNPFTVQEIADSLKGTNIPVMIKNPINPDLKLWIGAIERFQAVGINSIAAIHRGFSSYGNKKYRNEPLWQIPIGLRQEKPEIPTIADPSHISGKRKYLYEISQKAMDLSFDGLMLEVHPNPDKAMSDPEQQIRATEFADFISKIQVREGSFVDPKLLDLFDRLRHEIDEIDEKIIQSFAERMKIVEEIGEYKRDKNVAIFQAERWAQILNSRGNWANENQLNIDFIEKIYRLIHDESLRIQTKIYNSDD